MALLKRSFFILFLASLTLPVSIGCSSKKAEKIDAGDYVVQDEEGEESEEDLAD